MTYDAKDGYVVLFGGSNSTGFLNDTWKFSAGKWTKLNLAVHPSARVDVSMAYDSADGYVVMFGGSNSTSILNDTWKFAGGHWTELNLKVHPAAEYAGSMTFDSADNYTLLFGGVYYNSSTATLFDMTWKFVSGAWTQLHPSSHPSVRAGEALSYDARDGYVVLFGGCTYPSGFCGKPAADTWKFVSGAWTKLKTSTHPSARGAPAALYDSVDRYVLLFGGSNNTTSYGDTWTFASGTWTHLTPSTHPSARVLSGFAFDAKDGYVVLFGGLTLPKFTELGDTWSYVAGSWTKR